MLTQVDIFTRRGATLSLPFSGEDILTVDKIEGLGPVKSTLVTSSFAGMDGEQHHASRRISRNIKLSLGFDPSNTEMSFEALRDELYSILMPKFEVRLRFYRHTGFYVDIIGIVESLEPDVFVEEPTLELSIMCFKPDFLDPNPKTIDGMTASSMESVDIDYEGTVETGIEFKLFPNRALSSFTIYHIPPGEVLRQLDFTVPLQNQDELTISTTRGSKYAILKRAGVETSVVYGVPPQSKWTELLPGPNELFIMAPGPPIPWTLTRTDRYGGL